MKRESDTIRRCSINGPMSIVNLPNSQRSRQRQTVRCTTHLRCRGYNKHVAYLAQRLLKHLQTVRVDAVVIRNQNARHCCGAEEPKASSHTCPRPWNRNLTISCKQPGEFFGKRD